MLKVGDRIKDNDPRMTGRVLRVLEIWPTHIKAVASYCRPVTIRIDRIYPAGSARKSGFTVIEEEQTNVEH